MTSLLNRIMNRIASEPLMRQVVSSEVHEAVGADEGDLLELEIVGESHTQHVLGAIAGRKDAEGKRERVGVTLRCQPDNTYDGNAIRVEVMGQLTGHVSRGQAGLLSPLMQHSCAGALEAVGMIVGGWDDGDSSGYYGIRVWITQRDARRLGVRSDQIDSTRRQR